MEQKRSVALVLGGGGARGIAHIGAIEELERQGFEVSAVAGTSMGALVGACMPRVISSRSRSGCVRWTATRCSAWSISPSAPRGW